MRHIFIAKQKVLASNSLSSEYFLGTQSTEGSRLSDYCKVLKVTSSKANGITLDTNGANNGFIQLIHYGKKSEKSKTHRKILPKGCVAISRLRTYLRQVLCFSDEISEILETEQLTVSSEFVVLMPKNCSTYELTLLLLSQEIQKHLQDCTAGGHHPRVTDELMLAAPVLDDQFSDIKGKVDAFRRSATQYTNAQVDYLKKVSS